MITLTGYISPAQGARFTTQRIVVNPNLIAHMSEYSGLAEREKDGRYTTERVTLTSISFAAAFAEETVGVTVTESLDEIFKQIHFWKLDQLANYGAL